MAKKITLTIQGMECPNCAMKLESIEDKLAGVLQTVSDISPRISTTILIGNRQSAYLSVGKKPASCTGSTFG